MSEKQKPQPQPTPAKAKEKIKEVLKQVFLPHEYDIEEEKKAWYPRIKAKLIRFLEKFDKKDSKELILMEPEINELFWGASNFIVT